MLFVNNAIDFKIAYQENFVFNKALSFSYSKNS